MTGKFITMESSEGAGKGTAKDFIHDCLTTAGHRVVMTREPGGTPLAERIREILLSPTDERLANTAELLLMFASREQHIQEVIEPNVANGSIVVCERFVDSTYAYQHYARKLPRELIDGLVDMLKPRVPDITFLLDIDPVIGMARVSSRGAMDRIEQEHMDFFHRVRAGYLTRAKDDTVGRFRIIDAEKSIPEVRGQFINHLLNDNLISLTDVTVIKGKYDVEESR